MYRNVSENILVTKSTIKTENAQQEQQTFKYDWRYNHSIHDLFQHMSRFSEHFVKGRANAHVTQIELCCMHLFLR